MKKKFMIPIMLCLIIISCNNKKNFIFEDLNNKNSNIQAAEDFNLFYTKFYIDTIFQKQRILKPLKGTIKSIDEDDKLIEESWLKNKITITAKEEFKKVYKNLKTDLIKSDTLIIEKYWIEQSGFSVEKKYILNSGKWFLYSYNITNL